MLLRPKSAGRQPLSAASALGHRPATEASRDARVPESDLRGRHLHDRRVALLSGWAGVLTLHVLSKTMLALSFVPASSSAPSSPTTCSSTSASTRPRQDTNVVVACTLGIIVALLALLVVTRS